MHKEELIKFWKSSASGIRILEFLKGFFSIAGLQCCIAAFFHNLAYISGQSDLIFMEILSQLYQWTKKCPLRFGSNPETESGSRPYSPWRTYMQSRTVLVITALIITILATANRQWPRTGTITSSPSIDMLIF